MPLLQVSYSLQYVVGPKAIKPGPQKKQNHSNEGSSSSSSSSSVGGVAAGGGGGGGGEDQYAKALKDFKLQWMK